MSFVSVWKMQTQALAPTMCTDPATEILATMRVLRWMSNMKLTSQEADQYLEMYWNHIAAMSDENNIHQYADLVLVVDTIAEILDDYLTEQEEQYIEKHDNRE